jgi:hypothetical protein
VLIGEALYGGQDLGLEQVGGVAVLVQGGGGWLTGGVAGLLVEQDGAGGEGLVGAVAVEQVADGLGGVRVGGGTGGLLQVPVGLRAALFVDVQRLLAGEAEVLVVADEQDVGELGVHVVEGQIQVGGGHDDRGGLVCDGP